MSNEEYTLTFKEAMKAMGEGKKLQNSGNKNYVYYVKDSNIFMKGTITRDIRPEVFGFSKEFFALRWKVVE